MDSTGVPHVLEHTVLCGSRKYPCRDPFFKMLNRSLSTFMNAFTGEAGVGAWDRGGVSAWSGVRWARTRLLCSGLLDRCWRGELSGKPHRD